VQLTLAFASVMAILLAATGVLIYVQFAHDLDRRLDAELIDRGRTVLALQSDGASAAEVVDLTGEALSQVFAADGRVLASTRRVRGSRLLTAGQARRALDGPLLVHAEGVQGDDGARVRAVALSDRSRVVAIGESLRPREESLHRLAIRLAVTLPAALLLASLAGLQVAKAAMRPVERMRARAAAIGASDLHERLPVPDTGDELARLAATLNELLGRIEGAMERERRIVGDASHELRTPISVLRTRLEVALRGGGDDPAALRDALSAALADAERLSRLADDLLVLARADQGRLPLRREPLDVQEVLERAAQRHRAPAGAAGRALEVHVDVAGGAVVLADPDRVAQALDNLVVNALRYGGGAIELRARRAPGGVALVVADHGCGFPADFVDRAFERFSQADEGDGRAGSGLGLALVEAIARAHGGRAAVGVRAGGGAEAQLVLPEA
jgi:signal transduction histidine kinase